MAYKPDEKTPIELWFNEVKVQMAVLSRANGPGADPAKIAALYKDVVNIIDNIPRGTLGEQQNTDLRKFKEELGEIARKYKLGPNATNNQIDQKAKIDPYYQETLNIVSNITRRLSDSPAVVPLDSQTSAAPTPIAEDHGPFEAVVKGIEAIEKATVALDEALATNDMAKISAGIDKLRRVMDKYHERQFSEKLHAISVEHPDLIFEAANYNNAEIPTIRIQAEKLIDIANDKIEEIRKAAEEAKAAEVARLAEVKAQPPAPQGGAEAKEKDRSEQKEPAAKPPERKEGGFFTKLKSVFSADNKHAKSAAENKSAAAGTSSSATALSALGGTNSTPVNAEKSISALEKSAKEISKLSNELMGLHAKQQNGFIMEKDINRINQLKADLNSRIQSFQRDYKELIQLDIKTKSPDTQQRLKGLSEFHSKFIDTKDEHGLPLGNIVTRIEKDVKARGPQVPTATTPPEPRPVSPHHT